MFDDTGKFYTPCVKYAVAAMKRELTKSNETKTINKEHATLS